jgi:hypothetical protein
MADGERRLYAALAGSVSRGEHCVLGDARHSIVTIDRPDAVIQAIRDLFARANHHPGCPPVIAPGLTTTSTGKACDVGWLAGVSAGAGGRGDRGGPGG